jgi:hypothetical protein
MFATLLGCALRRSEIANLRACNKITIIILKCFGSILGLWQT